MKWSHVAILLVMGFTIVVLILNIRDRDAFDGGTTTPTWTSPDPIAEHLLPATVTHSCPTCGECAHPIEILESRRVLTIINHRPWYKLAWPRDKTIYFDDLIHLAACLQNRAARDHSGEWTVRGRIGPAIHPAAAPHDCGHLAVDFFGTLNLVTSPSPDWGQDVLRQSLWEKEALIYRYQNPRLPPVLYFGWSGDAKVNDRSCPCGKP